MAAVVGALRVDLGLNSAEFQAGLKNAQNGLGNFAKAAGIGLAAVATAAAAAGAALSSAVKGAIDNADELSKTAQKVGLTTEALSRLNYAAGLSDVSLEQLASGMQRLTQSMSQVAQGTGAQAKVAFDALGISALNANGTLRSSGDVLADVADKFARMEDGSTKTALAIALFGRSGADLIPLLNIGRDGLAQMADESDRLGATISTSTGRAAEQFNDTLTRLGSVFQGVINKIAAGVLPALNNFGDKLADPQFAASAQAIGQAIVQAMSLAVDAINTTVGAFNALREAMNWASTHDMLGREIKGGQAPGSTFQPFQSREHAIDELRDKLSAGQTGADTSDIYQGIFGASAPEVVTTNQQLAASFEPVITNTKEAASGASALNSVMAEGKAVFEATRTPAEAYALELGRLNGLLAKGAIDHDTFSRAVAKAKEELDAADTSATSLSSTIANDIGSAIGNLISGTKDLGSALGQLAGQIAQLLLKQGASTLGGLGGGFGFIGDLLGGLFGFANGGQFRVGGAGGIDSQLVAFKASPNETVSITKPGQERSAQQITIHQTFPIQGAITDKTVVAMVQQGAAQAVEAVRQQLPAWQSNIQVHGSP